MNSRAGRSGFYLRGFVLKPDLNVRLREEMTVFRHFFRLKWSGMPLVYNNPVFHRILDFKRGCIFILAPFLFLYSAKASSMIPDIEPILQVLSNYIQRIPLSDDELNLLRSWLMELDVNEILFDDNSNKAKWENNCPPNTPPGLPGSMERIRLRIISNLENEI